MELFVGHVEMRDGAPAAFGERLVVNGIPAMLCNDASASGTFQWAVYDVKTSEAAYSTDLRPIVQVMSHNAADADELHEVLVSATRIDK